MYIYRNQSSLCCVLQDTGSAELLEQFRREQFFSLACFGKIYLWRV
jgi:hypothetical protein